MENNKLFVTDESGKEIEMEIMFTFSENGKNYVVYLLDEKTCISGTTDENGFVQEDELKQGRYFIIFEE